MAAVTSPTGNKPANTFVCSGCNALMSYPNGAVLVSCATCETVSNVAPSSNLAIQIPCVSCKHLLQFPLSTSLAQCPLCKVVFCIKTHVQQDGPASPQAQSTPEPSSRPTTSSTRTSIVLKDAPTGHVAVTGEAGPQSSAGHPDWQSVWQGSHVKEQTSEQKALMDEFAMATAAHDAKASSKRKH